MRRPRRSIMPFGAAFIVAPGVALGAALALAVALGAVAGCGPIVYVTEVNRHASDSVDAARAANAEKYAPYWWTRATQYLAKAREVAAHADFQGANRFGRLAAEAAEQARLEAQLAARDPSKRPLDLPPDLPPDLRPDLRPEVAPAKEPPGASSPVRDAPAPPPAGPAPKKPPPAKPSSPTAPAKEPP